LVEGRARERLVKVVKGLEEVDKGLGRNRERAGREESVEGRGKKAANNGVACNKTLLHGPAVQVFYKPKVIRTPVGCADVELVVEGV